ncbi:MAG TPA: cytidine deaminase [Chthoniobacteraceae bacterium]|nr:cytidine deaminase [Chthoniobacteraceae bacterium]
MTSEHLMQLIERAKDARERAYAPYSRFAVGAALLTTSNEVFCGCNVENLSFGLTSCAERNAVFAAVQAGQRRFTAVAVVADSKAPVTPCGACRQVLAEFGLDLVVISVNLQGATYQTSIAELLPRAREGILGT